MKISKLIYTTFYFCYLRYSKCYPKHSILRLEQHFSRNFIGDEKQKGCS